jgi:hypothetical protein
MNQYGNVPVGLDRLAFVSMIVDYAGTSPSGMPPSASATPFP